MKHFLLYGLLMATLWAAPCAFGQTAGHWAKALQASKHSPQQLRVLLNKIQQENQRLRIQNAQTRSFQTQLFQTIRPSIFRALPSDQKIVNSYTGAIFQTEYEGKPEIYGVISMHALKDTPQAGGHLSQQFMALVEKEGDFVLIPAEVVQLSSSKMADVALVQFRPEDQKTLTPLVLENPDVPPTRQVYSAGYACNLFTRQSFPIAGNTSTGLLKTMIPAAHQGERSGFCGSPLVNEQAQLTAIHIGSNYGKAPTLDFAAGNPGVITPVGADTGYATPAVYLQGLVEAYHHPDKPFWPLTFNGQEITRLTAQEYVVHAELLDKQQHVLWKADTNLKMTLHPLQVAFQTFPQARFVRLVIGKTHWKNDETEWVVVDDDTMHRVVLTKLDSH